MKKLKVAIVQCDTIMPDVEQNAKTAIKFIREASKNRADLVLFPECFLTAYAVPDICEELLPVHEIENHPEFIKWCENALTEEDPHFLKIAELAGKLKIGIVITGFSKGKKYPQNTAWIIDRDGKVILKYSKVHTCDFDWERYLESGESFPVCKFDDITMGCMICYDREYPESARELMLNGAELIMHPNSCGGMPPRLKELSVRAMENMVGIAMANPPAHGMGNSCAFNPMVWTKEGEPLDNTIFVGDELEETIYYVEFDLDEIRAYRGREDLGKYRKPEAYKKIYADDDLAVCNSRTDDWKNLKGVTNITIREAGILDAFSICKISCEDLGYQCSNEFVSNRLNNLDKKREIVFVAQIKDTVVGYIHAEKYNTLYFDSMVNILGLAVSADYRRNGVGKALLNHTEKWAKGLGISLVRLNFGITRKGAHDFYRAMGYDNEKEQIRFMKYLD